MSEREKQILDGVSKLPDSMKDRFLDKIEGAVMALDMLGAMPPPQDQKGEPKHGP